MCATSGRQVLHTKETATAASGAGRPAGVGTDGIVGDFMGDFMG